MKYFSLIYGEELHPAKNDKVIPSKEFSTLLDSKELILKLKEDSQKFRTETAAECEKIKEKAKDDGFNEGLSQWLEKKAKFNQELKRIKAEMEKLIIPLAIKAAKKIVNTELKAKPELITNIIEEKLKAVASDSKVTIYANKENLAHLEKDKNKLKKIFEALEVFILQERADITPGGCVIETEHGIINAQWEKQWDSLEKLFNQLLNKQG